MKPYNQFKKNLLKDKKIKKAYEELGPEFELAQIIIANRVGKGLTQNDLAKKIGTKQSAIARLESGEYNPTLGLLNKVAKALNTHLKVTLSQ